MEPAPTSEQMSSGDCHICTEGRGPGDDWVELYRSSFPDDEKMTVEAIRDLLDRGVYLLHRTTNKSDELLCFSICLPLSNFLMLSYVATDPTKRSGGYGSKHLKRLVELLGEKYPDNLALFLEIDSPAEPGLSDEEKKQRSRRLKFYKRLGAKRFSGEYFFPSMITDKPIHRAELLWIELDGRTVEPEVLPGIIREIYEKEHLLKADDPLITKVLSQLK